MSNVRAADHVDYVALFADERQALLAFLGSLERAEWTRPTPCPGWSILDLVCHLVGDDFGLLSRQRDGHAGLGPPAGSPFDTWLDAVQDDWVHSTRRLSPRLAVDLLTWTGPQIVEMFLGQDPGEVAATVTWAGPDPVPRWLDHARELSEYWIHHQQLHLAVDRPPELAERAGPVLDALRWAYPFRLAALHRPEDDTVAITVEGEVERHWCLRSNGTGWEFSAPVGNDIARLRMTTDQAWRLLTNNLSPDAQRDLEFTGDAAVVDVLRRTRAIIGTPNTDDPTVT